MIRPQIVGEPVRSWGFPKWSNWRWALPVAYVVNILDSGEQCPPYRKPL
ncbi:hypothetical protein [Chlorogloeopsis fritschii]|nr:hypothetical protein [Chlorogloeopsis fritschii]